MFTLEQFVRNERTRQDSKGHGIVANYTPSDRIGDVPHFDPGLMRPYRDDRGRVWVDVTVGHEPVVNSYNEPVLNAQGQPKWKPIYDPQLVDDRRRKDLPVINGGMINNATTLSKDQWIMLDAAVLTASRKRLRLWADMRAASTFGGFDGMATPILEFERLTDVGEAVSDMNGLSEGRNFTPQFELQGMPLPITHCDFWLDQRFLAVSRKGGGRGADTIRAEMAGRRVGEHIEQTAIGTQTGVVYGVNTDYPNNPADVFGLTNHGDRITKTDMTAMTSSNGTTILSEWLTCLDNLADQNVYGPFTVYNSAPCDEFLDNDFKTNSDKSVRSRLLENPSISTIRRLDYLTTADVLLFCELGEQIQAVNGMELTTVQWEEKGGMQLNFKVMAIQVPRIRSTYVNSSTTGPAAGNSTRKTSYLHATTS